MTILWHAVTSTDNPLNTRDPMGMGLGTKSNPWRVMGFLVGIFYINGHGFGMAKPSGFVPVAIFTSSVQEQMQLYVSCQKSSSYLTQFLMNIIHFYDFKLI